MLDRLELLNNVDRSQKFPVIPPRDAASLLLIDRREVPYKLLMGLRHQKSTFMPDVYVFPGGGLDDQDIELAKSLLEDFSLGRLNQFGWFASRLNSDPSRKEPESNVHGMALHGMALALCGLRELFEETGLHLTSSNQLQGIEKGAHPFAEQDLEQIFNSFIFLSRAITPPGRKKRYDTRFFIHDYRDAIMSHFHKDDELSDTRWVTFDEAIQLKIHPMTRVILEDLHDYLSKGTSFTQPASVAFYHYEGTAFQRDLLQIKTDT